MALDRKKFTSLLNTAASVNFTTADNVPYPARKACAVCPSPMATGGTTPTGTVLTRPANLGVVAPTSPCPNPVRRWNASAQVPATPTGLNHWATCSTAPSQAGSIPIPSLVIIPAYGTNPPAGYNPLLFIKVGPIGSMV